MAEENLKRLGIELPEAPAPVASYVPCVQTGNLLFISGQIPKKGDTLLHNGKLGAGVSIEEGQVAARQCVINSLAQIKKHTGSLDKVNRIVKLGVFVNSAPDFVDQPKVANGASDLLIEVFGDNGRHARSAVGVPSLPLGASVEVEMIVELKN